MHMARLDSLCLDFSCGPKRIGGTIPTSTPRGSPVRPSMQDVEGLSLKPALGTLDDPSLSGP